MTALQQEAIRILQEIPEDRLVSVIQYMRMFRRKDSNSPNHYLTDALTGIIPPEVDFESERRELLEKKYAIVD